MLSLLRLIWAQHLIACFCSRSLSLRRDRLRLKAQRMWHKLDFHSHRCSLHTSKLLQLSSNMDHLVVFQMFSWTQYRSKLWHLQIGPCGEELQHRRKGSFPFLCQPRTTELEPRSLSVHLIETILSWTQHLLTKSFYEWDLMIMNSFPHGLQDAVGRIWCQSFVLSLKHSVFIEAHWALICLAD